MTYAEECRLRAKYLLEAADGVEFEIDRSGLGDWADVYIPTFDNPKLYRRKPKKVRHERVVVWYKHSSSEAVLVGMYANDDAASRQMYIHKFHELKRETVYCEVEEQQ